MHLQTLLWSGSAGESGWRSAGDDSSKPENQAGRAPRKVEPAGVNDVEVDVTKGPEVAKVAANANVAAEEEHGAAAKVPGRLAVIEAQHSGERVDVGTDDPQTRRHIRPEPDTFLSTDRNAEQQIPGRSKNAAAADIGSPIEIRTVGDIGFDTEDPRAHIREAGSPIEALGIDRVRQFLS